MDALEVAEVVASGMTHDASVALIRISAGVAAEDQAARAAEVFLLILVCRFDDALDLAQVLEAEDRAPTRLVRAACDLAHAVCAARAPFPAAAVRSAGLLDDGPLGEITSMLEAEVAMSSGLIAAAAATAGAVVDRRGVETAAGVWSALALARARCFEGRFAEADELVAQALVAPSIAEWPQLYLLASGVRIFVDAHLGRECDVLDGLARLGADWPAVPEDAYIVAGTHVLAAFGATAIGRRTDGAELILRAGGGVHLPHLQVVDRLYGYEVLVEDAVSRTDLVAARTWSEWAESQPIGDHPMAGAALGRIRARLAVASSDATAGMRESADSGALAARAGGDLEVIRARIIEAAARVASGDRVRGLEELEEVARSAASTGAASIKQWAERELNRFGRSLRNVPGHGWETLTETQQSVARLAATGLRNREIATALWIAEKTVEHHVAAVLGALGTTNRVGIGRELGGAAIDPLFGPGLTARQREVAVLIARGCSNADISGELGISEKTVEKHVAGLFGRLGVSTRAAVAARVRGSVTD